MTSWRGAVAPGQARGATLDCWGEDGSSQLGDALTADRGAPFAHSNSWRSVAAGDSFTCAVRSAGELYCWGSQLNGRLGDDVITATTVTGPVRTGLDLWARVAAGGSGSCAILQTGGLACWGPRADGMAAATHPTPVGDSLAWTQLELGSLSGVAFQGDTLFSWGQGKNGANGLDRTFYPTPLPVPR